MECGDDGKTQPPRGMRGEQPERGGKSAMHVHQIELALVKDFGELVREAPTRGNP